MQRDANFRVLCLLQGNPRITQRELAAAVGISNGGAHYVLSALLARGLIKVENFSASRHKHRYAYILTPSGLAEKASITRGFLQRKRAEYDALRREIDALEQSLAEAPQSEARAEAVAACLNATA
jgi:EPS-associated MarR family transcriptional regulator